MATQLHEVECETRTIGPLVLTTPGLRRLDFRGIVHRYCPIAAPAELDHGLVAARVTQSRLSAPRALYDLPGWAEQCALPTLYPEIKRTGPVNDDRAGRMLDALYDQRAVIWGDLVAHAARYYGLAVHRLHADTMAMTFAGLCAAHPAVAGVPRLEPGDNPGGEWRQPVKLFALAAGAGGLPVWFDVRPGGTGESTTSVPPFAACSEHVQLAHWLPVEDMLLMGDRKMPTAENQLTWLRLHLGYIGPLTLQDQHCQTLRDLLAAGQTWQALPSMAKRDTAKPPAQRTGYQGLGHTVERTDPADPTRHWSVRHLSMHASALASWEAARRHNAMQAIEAALQRLQGLVNTYAYKTPAIITRRVHSKAFKKRQAQKYVTIEVVHHADRPTAPLELRDSLDPAQRQRDAALAGVDL